MVERRQTCALQKSASRIARCGGCGPSVCRRSASFFYLFLESLIWRNGRNGRPKGRPHPCPSLDRTGFALEVTVFYWRAIVRDRAYVTSSRSWRSEREWIPVPGSATLSAPAKRGRGTTGAREASEPWWRGRRTRSFVIGAESSRRRKQRASENVWTSRQNSCDASSPAPPPPPLRPRASRSAFFT